MAYLPEPDYKHTPQAKVRRGDKAEILAEFLLDKGIAKTPDAAQRREIARDCGLNPKTSDETWILALTIWQERR